MEALKVDHALEMERMNEKHEKEIQTIKDEGESNLKKVNRELETVKGQLSAEKVSKIDLDKQIQRLNAKCSDLKGENETLHLQMAGSPSRFKAHRDMTPLNMGLTKKLTPNSVSLD